MSIPSDSSRNIYCPPQSYGARMVMIPSVRHPANIFPLNCPQNGMNFQINAPIPYRVIRYNSPAQYQQIMNAHGISSNLHGNENNTNVNSNNSPTMDDASKSDETRNEDPLDLSSTNLSSFSSSSVSPRENESNSEKANSPNNSALKSLKKEPITPPSSQAETNQQEKESEPETYSSSRAHKPSFYSDERLLHSREVSGWVGHVKPVPGIPRQAGSKREEVLKAAKSLFSKRTRTLYHWLYPTTSKNKLKATVAAAWDTLSTAEKDFYISQVLGRFGVPAGSLMVNPQLGGFKGISGSPSGGSSSLLDETGNAVTNMLLSEDDVAWTSYPQAQVAESGPRKRRRQTRNSHGESSSSRQHQDDEETRILKQIREESLEDDFADDPELSKEFQQFRLITEHLDVSDLNLNLNDILDGI